MILIDYFYWWRSKECLMNYVVIFIMFIWCQRRDSRELANKIFKNLADMGWSLFMENVTSFSKSRFGWEIESERIVVCWWHSLLAIIQKKWSEGLRIIQRKRNSSLHSVIKISPYDDMLGFPEKVALTDSNLSSDISSTSIEAEKQYELLLSSMQLTISEKTIEQL